MGNVATAFNNTFVDGDDVDKADCRAIGQEIEDYVAAPRTHNANAAGSPTSAPSGYIRRAIGADGNLDQLDVIDGFGGVPGVRLRRANGTGASPTAVLSGEVTGRMDWSGYYTTGGPGYALRPSSIRGEATENWTSTAQGARAVIATTPNGTATPVDAFYVGQDQSARAKGALGYINGQGAGGAVTQLTSRATGVTLNAVTGQITLFSAAGQTTLSTASRFTLTNSKIEATDTLQISLINSPNNLVYFFGSKCAAGSADIWLMASAATVEAPVIQFNLFKGANN
jgi:hypothetical protein